MKKLLLFALCALSVPAFASEAGDKKAVEEAAKLAKQEKRRQELNEKAAKLAASKPKQAARLVKKSIALDPNNPTGNYILATVIESPQESRACLAAAATASRQSAYKDEARQILNKKNSETAIAAFIKELKDKIDTDISLEDLIFWIKEKSQIFPDKEDFIAQVESAVLGRNASWLDAVSAEIQKLKRR